MILDLNKENLIKCGFDSESIDKILNWDDYVNYQLFSDNHYLAIQSEKKIYIGIEAERKNMLLNKNCFPERFPDLFIEYYNLHLNIFLESRKQLLGTLYNEQNEITDFKSQQRELFETKIQWQKDFIIKMKGREHDSRKKTILLYQRYITEIVNKLHQPIKVRKHSFEDLFCDKNDIERCLKVLRDLEKPVITEDNKYTKNQIKGVFPLWIEVLKNHKPKSLINILSEIEYTQILNNNIEGLNLTKDASEFRKSYITLEKNNIKYELKALLA